MPSVSLLFLFNSGSVCPNLILKLELQALPFPDGISNLSQSGPQQLNFGISYLSQSGPQHHIPFPPVLIPQASSPSLPQSFSLAAHPFSFLALCPDCRSLHFLGWCKEQNVRSIPQAESQWLQQDAFTFTELLDPQFPWTCMEGTWSVLELCTL